MENKSTIEKLDRRHDVNFWKNASEERNTYAMGRGSSPPLLLLLNEGAKQETRAVYKQAHFPVLPLLQDNGSFLSVLKRIKVTKRKSFQPRNSYLPIKTPRIRPHGEVGREA